MRFPRHGIVTLLACCLIGSCETADYNRGQNAARESIARDELLFLDPFGIVRADTEEHRAFLHHRFGISYQLDREVTASFADGFNSTMDAEARKRFGDSYAAAFFEQKYPEFGPVRVKPVAESQ